jgi:hypothetical protein
MEWLSGVVQGILGTLLYDLLLAAMVAAFITWLKSQESRWAAPLLYGMGAFTAVLIISYVLTGHALLSKEAETTAENVEQNIKKWVDEFGLGIQKNPNINNPEFAYTVTLKGGNTVTVARSKPLPEFLQFAVELDPAPASQQKMSRLNQEQMEAVAEDVTAQLALSKVGYTIQSDKTNPLHRILIAKSVPITRSLTEASFADALNEIDAAIGLTRAAISQAIRRNSQR